MSADKTTAVAVIGSGENVQRQAIAIIQHGAPCICGRLMGSCDSCIRMWRAGYNAWWLWQPPILKEQP